jgi:type IV pilus assembly protein PilW
MSVLRKITSTGYRRSKRQSGKRQLGFTLIELMIGVALGVLLVTGVISIFTSNQQSFKINSDLARLQESARFAYEQMNREIRDTGTNPCGVRAVNSIVRTATASIPWWGDWNAGTLRGYDAGEEVGIAGVPIGASVNNRVTGTDAIVVLRTINDDGQLRAIANHDASLNQITLNGTQNFGARDLAFVCDNSSGVIFQVSTVSAPVRINYDVSLPTANCSTSLGWANNTDCTANAVSKTFVAGSFATKFDPAIWYIGLTNNGQRALFRETIFNDGTNITTERREFVPDVTDMQIKYLLRTKNADPTIAPTLATTWVDASVINAQAGQWGSANLNEAVAVQIQLTFQSDNNSGTSGNVSQPLVRNTISVISLRNREIVR